MPDVTVDAEELEALRELERIRRIECTEWNVTERKLFCRLDAIRARQACTCPYPHPGDIEEDCPLHGSKP